MGGDREKLYTVTELAERLGVTARAIRFYETKGLLSPQRVGSTRVRGVRIEDRPSVRMDARVGIPAGC